jgi:tripartite-type tricarboxylate transporter receptor subunit TctC
MIRSLTVLFCSLAAINGALAQTYPAKPAKLLVGFAAGGATDITARIVAAKVSEIWGQQLIVENRPGAGGTLAADLAAKAPADGYTLFACAIGSHGIAPALFKKLPYDHIRDFAPISLLGTTPNVMVVHPSVSARSVAEFIAYAKGNPGKINYGSAGAGSSPHLSVELFKLMTGINMVHVPYKGGSQGLTDLLGGQIQMMITNVPSQLASIRAGKIRALAVTTTRRAAQLPHLPTMAEAGVPDYEVTVWYGMCAPAGLAKLLVERLNTDVVKALNSPETQQRLADQGIDAAPMTPDQFAAFIRAETAKWAKVVRDSGATAD